MNICVYGASSALLKNIYYEKTEELGRAMGKRGHGLVFGGGATGMMDADLAAKIMYAGDDAAALTEKAAEYRELQNSVSSAAARGYVDTIISPADTRKYVVGAFEMLFTKREERPSKKHGTV